MLLVHWYKTIKDVYEDWDDLADEKGWRDFYDAAGLHYKL